MLSHSQKILGGLGSFAREQGREVQYLAAVLGTTLFLSAQPRRWRLLVVGYLLAVAIIVAAAALPQLRVSRAIRATRSS